MNEPLFYVLWIALVVLIWLRMRSKSGLQFGNEIADSLEIDRDFFHTMLAEGLKEDSPRRILAELKKRKLTAGDAAIELAPALAQGLVELEENLALQAVATKTKPRITQLINEWTQLHGKAPSVAAALNS